MNLFEQLAEDLNPSKNAELIRQVDDYDRDEDGNLISCCGDILDTDVMICPTCKEHN